MCSPRAVTLPPGWGSFPNRSRPGTVPSSARYPGVVIATCGFCSCRQHGTDQTENLGAPRAQVLDRGGQKATAPQRARDRAGQQAGPHRLVSPGPWSGLRDEVSHRPTCLIVEYGNVRWEIRDDVARSITLTCRGLREDETRWRF